MQYVHYIITVATSFIHTICVSCKGYDGFIFQLTTLKENHIFSHRPYIPPHKMSLRFSEKQSSH